MQIYIALREPESGKGTNRKRSGERLLLEILHSIYFFLPSWVQSIHDGQSKEGEVKR